MGGEAAYGAICGSPGRVVGILASAVGWVESDVGGSAFLLTLSPRLAGVAGPVAGSEVDRLGEWGELRAGVELVDPNRVAPTRRTATTAARIEGGDQAPG